jgi:hypothetical protein
MIEAQMDKLKASKLRASPVNHCTVEAVKSTTKTSLREIKIHTTWYEHHTPHQGHILFTCLSCHMQQNEAAVESKMDVLVAWLDTVFFHFWRIFQLHVWLRVSKGSVQLKVIQTTPSHSPTLKKSGRFEPARNKHKTKTKTKKLCPHGPSRKGLNKSSICSPERMIEQQLKSRASKSMAFGAAFGAFLVPNLSCGRRLQPRCFVFFPNASKLFEPGEPYAPWSDHRGYIMLMIRLHACNISADC